MRILVRGRVSTMAIRLPLVETFATVASITPRRFRYEGPRQLPRSGVSRLFLFLEEFEVVAVAFLDEVPLRDEAEGGGVDAVAKTIFARAVREDVSQV